MSGESNFLDVKIMGREYRVACTAEERDALLQAVDMVDAKMREIAQRTKSTIAERVAVMAALNIAHELLSGTSGSGYSSVPRPTPSAVPPYRKNGTSLPSCAPSSASLA